MPDLQHHQPSKFVGTKAVCNRYGCSRATLHRWRNGGAFPQPVYIGGGGYPRWEVARLDAYDEQRHALADQ